MTEPSAHEAESLRGLDARPYRMELSPFHAAARLRRVPFWMRLLAHLPEPRRWNPKRVWSGTCLLQADRDI